MLKSEYELPFTCISNVTSLNPKSYAHPCNVSVTSTSSIITSTIHFSILFYFMLLTRTHSIPLPHSIKFDGLHSFIPDFFCALVLITSSTELIDITSQNPSRFSLSVLTTVAQIVTAIHAETETYIPELESRRSHG